MRRMAADGRGWLRSQRVLHWATALLVVAAFVIAWPMVVLPFRLLLLKFTLYQVHKTLGLLVALTAAVRLALLARFGRPAWDEALGSRGIRLARAGHGLLYALLIVVPLLGYATASSAPLRIPTLFLGLVDVPHLVPADAAVFAAVRWVHLGLAVLLVLLAVGHGGMAVLHHRRGRAVLTRMWNGGRRL